METTVRGVQSRSTLSSGASMMVAFLVFFLPDPAIRDDEPAGIFVLLNGGTILPVGLEPASPMICIRNGNTESFV